MLDNAWKGYNCSLFAYGQTGSGKSYSMVGYKANKGVCACVRACLCLCVCGMLVVYEIRDGTIL